MSDLTPQYIAFVEKEEGFAPVAFWDEKQWTNGYGTRAHYPREPITRPEAEQRLNVELDAAEAAVDHFASNIPPGARQALTDLTFNAGAGWMHAGLGVAVKAGDWETAKAHLLEYDRAGGKVSAGLLARRKAEEAWIA
jgi:lysozyme